MKQLILILFVMIMIQGCSLRSLRYAWDPRVYAEDKVEKEKARRETYVNSHSNINRKIEQNIIAGKISLGMTKNDVLASWGHPYDTYQTSGKWGRYDQWIYNERIDERLYVYFENGKLSSWSD